MNIDYIASINTVYHKDHVDIILCMSKIKLHFTHYNNYYIMIINS